jgi:hypothetical protein
MLHVTGRFVGHPEQTSTSYRQQAALPLGPHSLADAAAKAAPAVVNVTVQRGSGSMFNVRPLLSAAQHAVCCSGVET